MKNDLEEMGKVIKMLQDALLECLPWMECFCNNPYCDSCNAASLAKEAITKSIEYNNDVTL